MGFHGDRFIKSRFARVSVAPIKGVTSKTPRKPAHQGGEGVRDHIPELDKALESLYSVFRVGLKGVVGYVLY